ncbi:hypothetical protein CEP52_000793 [Fusarium oligoseptatum]|uniref:Uncharacterized protein n=1 Tax=Fusarium oligoseptatum TaxID=2604345 RepID=A0A428ULX6_9HYPO|nr:hypothetical protein CEP52_000793 [Fusarium oligoseptatum]
MSNIKAEIRDASHKNAELLRLLAETDHASSSHTQQQKIVSDLEKELARSDKKLHDLDQERLANLQTYKKYRDSHFRKFLITASGKKEWFASIAGREEQDYFETLQQTHQAQEHNSTLKAQLAEAQTTLQSAQNLVQRHRGVQRQLDELYDDIFSGPTPDFPEEDEKEQESNDALAAYFTTKAKLEAHSKAVELQEQAAQTMMMALQHMDKALIAHRTSSTLMERRALNQAKDDIQQTKRTIDQLSKLELDNGVLSRFNTEPLIRQLNSTLGDVWGRIDIKHICEEAARCASTLDDALSYARMKRTSVERELKEREFEMEEARQRLQKVREGIFERVMNEDMMQCPWDAP